MLKNIFLSEKKLLNAILRASKSTNSCFSANNKLWECEASLSQWESANAILRAKLKHMKNVLSNEMNRFAMQKKFSWVWAFLQKKSF